jgi:two-component system response regulator HydG
LEMVRMMAIHESLFGASRRGSLVGVVADSGQLVRIAKGVGVDFFLGLSAGLYRNRGVMPQAAYLPFANANELTERFVREEIVPAAGDVPVFMGLLAADLACSLDERLDRMAKLGVAGIVNYPSVSLLDGSFRQIFEDEGVTIEAEIAMLEQARAKGFMTLGFVGADVNDAAKFADANLDALIITSGPTHILEDIRERRDRLQHAIRTLNNSLSAIRKRAPALACLVFGGPITEPHDLEQVYRQAPFDGFVGGSVFGRYPIEVGVNAAIQRFKAVTAHPEGDRHEGLGPMIGTTPAMRELFRLTRRSAQCDLNVCIEGESGVGKELVATHIHRLSVRSHAALVTINCGAIPESLLESELFGHERGAFTGADQKRIGKFELADGGTLFLDEVGDLSPRGQVALLRAIQQREIIRVGGNMPISVDVRILAASNQPLSSLVAKNKFRADLYYRLNNLTLTVPALRERLDDIPLLVEPFLRSLSPRMSREIVGLTQGFLDKMRIHAWPGNLRELQHVIAQAALMEEGPWLTGRHFEPIKSSTSIEMGSMTQEVELDLFKKRRERVAQALSEAGGNKSKAASLLRISRKTLYAWIEEIEEANRRSD